MRDLKHLSNPQPAPVPAKWAQILVAVCAFGAGVLVNQHFTEKALEAATQARRVAQRAAADCAPRIVANFEESEQ